MDSFDRETYAKYLNYESILAQIFTAADQSQVLRQSNVLLIREVKHNVSLCPKVLNGAYK